MADENEGSPRVPDAEQVIFDALQKHIATLQPRLRDVALRRLSGDEEAAEGVMNDLCVEAWKVLRKWLSEPYLRRVVRNLCLKIIRDRWRSGARGGEPLWPYLSGVGSEERLIDVGDVEAVQQCLEILDEDERRILRLHVEAESLRKIGKAMGLHKDKVRRRLAKAKAKLNKCLSQPFKPRGDAP